MMKKTRNLIAIFRRFGLSPRLIVGLLFLQLMSIGFELVGIGLLLPVFETLRSGSADFAGKLQGPHWDVLRAISATTGVPLTLGVLLGVSFVFILLRQVFQYFNTFYYGVALRQAADKVRRRCFQGFLRANSAVQSQVRVGEFASDLGVELDRALRAVFATIRSFGLVVQVLIYAAGLFVLSAQMTLLSLVVIAFIALITRNLVKGVKRTAQAITDANLKLSGFIVERLQLARLIRLSGTERAEAKAFAEISRGQAEQALRQKLISTRMTLLPEPIAIGFGYSVLFAGGAVFGLSLAKLALFVLVLLRLMPIVKSVVTDYNGIVGNWTSVIRVDGRLVELAEAEEGKGGARVFERLDKAITYENASFSYGHGATPALRGMSVTIPAHKMTALVGPSGAGKSTFVDLLPRLRDLTGGEIKVDGVPLTEFSIMSLRKGIAFVPQQPQIFNISASEHIRYGKEDASDEEVREAARLAGATDFIGALPDSFDTLLGHGGQRLSGGQRQRLDIARALVRRAPILILDEPTSALDAEAEAAFRDALGRLRRDTDLTIIVIAHRLSTIANADQIVVVVGGRVEAVGSHKELMAQGGWFAEAVKTQSVESHDPAPSPALA
jgi:ATP-binding cassette, subfamily B, bacterial MsbA